MTRVNNLPPVSGGSNVGGSGAAGKPPKLSAGLKEGVADARKQVGDGPSDAFQGQRNLSRKELFAQSSSSTKVSWKMTQTVQPGAPDDTADVAKLFGQQATNFVKNQDWID